MEWTVAIGVDTDKEVHVVVALDALGAQLDSREIPTTPPVAASSAVPGVFPPPFRERSEFFGADVEIGLGFEPGLGDLSKPGRVARDAFTFLAFSDGGVVDNTRLETLVYRRIRTSFSSATRAGTSRSSRRRLAPLSWAMCQSSVVRCSGARASSRAWSRS
jgi:predicted acylesterase/phospholipase RssA